MGGVELLTGEDVWPAITAKCKATSRHHVAVAYLGMGAVERLPLVEGDLLVVNASPRSLRAGAVDPDALADYIDLGVEVVSVRNLHAKVYVLGKTLFIGSANNSESSAFGLVEAVVRTTDAVAVRDARELVETLAGEGEWVDDAFLTVAREQWRPPKGGGGHEPADRAPLEPIPEHPFRLLVVDSVDWEPSASDEERIEQVSKHLSSMRWGSFQTNINKFSDEPRVGVGDVIINGTDLDGSDGVLGPPEVVVHIEEVAGRWPHRLVFTRYATGLEDEVPAAGALQWSEANRKRSIRWITRADERQALLGLWDLTDPGPA